MFRFLCIAFLLLPAQFAFVHADESTPRVHNSHTPRALIGPLGRRTKFAQRESLACSTGDQQCIGSECCSVAFSCCDDQIGGCYPIGSTCTTGGDYCSGIVSDGSSIAGGSSTGGGSRGSSAGLSTWQAAGLVVIVGASLVGAAF
ncbi:hypothetical protein BKA82DRAFT_998784 [Pisolithus tinctorius]|uniref:Granulins domain-containing protein n=1 Tax=Pisolithus tinctorius Marx 270 TaxID=870435 RepID=A0A0C3P0M6_PISTI|nr:hypothetical protein BKA82DRAFT_998784 [Pisolithus tinctorius]KIO06660.1 hypothetical protein M404DRAFT_998784 [Pisolithus tinctorius Marx 270]